MEGDLRAELILDLLHIHQGRPRLERIEHIDAHVVDKSGDQLVHCAAGMVHDLQTVGFDHSVQALVAGQDEFAPHGRRHQQAVLDGYVIVGVDHVDQALRGLHQAVDVADHQVGITIQDGAGHFGILDEIHQEAVQAVKRPGRFKDAANFVTDVVGNLAIDFPDFGGQAGPIPIFRLGPDRPGLYFGGGFGSSQRKTGVFLVSAEIIVHQPAVGAPGGVEGTVCKGLRRGADVIRPHQAAVHPQQAEHFFFIAGAEILNQSFDYFWNRPEIEGDPVRLLVSQGGQHPLAGCQGIFFRVSPERFQQRAPICRGGG